MSCLPPLYVTDRVKGADPGAATRRKSAVIGQKGLADGQRLAICMLAACIDVDQQWGKIKKEVRS